MTKRKFEFEKNEKGEWYMNLPAWTGDPEDLQMVEGADQWLDLLSNGTGKVEVWLADEIFDGAEILTLIHVREANLGGGGEYYLADYQGENIGIKMWFCEVTSFVFDQIPQKIYFSAE